MIRVNIFPKILFRVRSFFMDPYIKYLFQKNSIIHIYTFYYKFYLCAIVEMFVKLYASFTNDIMRLSKNFTSTHWRPLNLSLNPNFWLKVLKLIEMPSLSFYNKRLPIGKQANYAPHWWVIMTRVMMYKSATDEVAASVRALCCVT